uniref:Uncharacterized protein n=1 Tax=Latimeria chalumnae TaxID=7897 RepID=H2ZSP5_LATCH
INLSFLIQKKEYEEQLTEGKVTGQTFRREFADAAATSEFSQRTTSKRTEFIFMPATRRVSEDETTTVGVRPQEAVPNLPTTSNKQTSWNKAFLLPTPEEKRWHQSSSVQARIVPINVSGEPFDRHATLRQSLFNTETALNPKSTLRRRRTITGIPEL